ncbi:glucuronate isomerase [Marispirochaeta aestuarii]|uniref:glucuronate isomerase n=1 Tax=Marispirochaeta aestuarii TaxID=1963862 RepID=UPI0029C8D4F4|nr:glucuronate isomerase [Marispirochaeta aestuarii]
MAKQFLDDDFMLQNDAARTLYHEYAADMPIFDYHCHLPPVQVAENKQFRNLTEIWLYGDHYKWRAMRANGVDERYCTGDAPDWDKFAAWAETVPKTIGNPLYHWTHMEMKDPFGISGKLLNPRTAKSIYEDINTKLASGDEFRARGIMEHFNVKAVCTTDDPADSLEHHASVAGDSSFTAKMYPAFRPDKSMAVDTGEAWIEYLARLGEAASMSIDSFGDLLSALDRRHEFFHSMGGRLSDHALTLPVYAPASDAELEAIFKKAKSGGEVSPGEADKFRTALMLHFGRMNAKRGWVMQLHMNCLRNNNTRLFRKLGPDTGLDGMADGQIAVPLRNFLDALDMEEMLPKTILYTLNPRDNELLASIGGSFQDGSTPGKIQLGTAWWFNDQKEGMLSQMSALANIGLLSRFVGMITDSRSFLSYPRHDYFRRILCNMVGTWVEEGEAPRDMDLLGGMIADISYNNARNYFGMEID